MRDYFPQKCCEVVEYMFVMSWKLRDDLLALEIVAARLEAPL
jgi:hypothetical protein